MPLLFLVTTLLLSNVVLASEIEPYSCRNGFFPAQVSDTSFYAKVNTKTHFYRDEQGCPYNQTCRASSYLINGDPVLVSVEQDGWSCVWYQAKERDFVGWIQSASLTRKTTDLKPPLSAWIGRWQYYDNEIFIRESEQQLELEGRAFWHGLNTVNLGGVSGLASPKGRTLSVVEGNGAWNCKVTLTIIGPYLAVTDNRNCGGMNVTFDGIYFKR